MEYGRLAGKWIGSLIFLVFLLSFQPGWAETLADVDAEIQTDKTLVKVAGQDAADVYAGVTNSRLDRKIAILNSAGITNFASSGSYSNFYSFTGTLGVTDTKIDIITTAATKRLYRRANGTAQETVNYLGSWYSGEYLGYTSTRNDQAVLAAWGSDLKKIYVIDVPTGITMVGGYASPMEKNGEYRYGGAYQYYYRGALHSWLVYALYAPDYLESYAAAVTAAQKTARTALEDVNEYLADLRYRPLPAAGGKPAQPGGESDIWFRFYGGNSRYGDGSADFNSDFFGLHGGWNKLARGGKTGEKDRLNFGALIGYGNFNQNDSASSVKNSLKNSYLGLYTLYQVDPAARRSWYGSAVATLGKLEFNNQVPGESGYGLNQSYSGGVFAVSLENGLTLRQTKGWYIEPQLQLLYTKLNQDNFRDNLGALITLRGNESLIGRIGVMALRKTQNQAGRQNKYWLKVSWLREFCGANAADVAGDLAQSSNSRNYYQLHAGVEQEIDRGLSISGALTQNFGDERGFRWNLLLTKTW